ncbi:right-handed parallel beta-helix repeat-containing protein [Desulfonatronum sp. SC1]|uniref:right-handed parallel beta-helix repeat-containing protein n=1 Tax=Desulfonatronum sp. SC1 TaxID=2109626 RepID=UPI000D30936C|nr:right-handed parallel beta-helix repeat-containing protein [Desulfonatronum sp. SC1]PTN33784.1 hypothetical protein C6366_13930 [Desulfonatronum sp. SC1]
MPRAFMLIISMLLYFPVQVFADFYVIPGGGPPAGTEIRSTPYIISSPGMYFLKKNLSCPAGTHCITIAADDVTLDLMGFSLSGSGGTGNFDGIHIVQRKNVEVRNGTILNFQRNGVMESGATFLEGRHRMINLRLYGNGVNGISLASELNTIIGCTATHNASTGIYSGAGSVFRDNVCSYNKFGLMAAHYASVIGNSCTRNSLIGIFCGPQCLIVDNVAILNGSRNIYTQASVLERNLAP